MLIKNFVVSMCGRELAGSFQTEMPPDFAADGQGYSKKKRKLGEVGDTWFKASDEDAKMENKEHVGLSKTTLSSGGEEIRRK